MSIEAALKRKEDLKRREESVADDRDRYRYHQSYALTYSLPYPLLTLLMPDIDGNSSKKRQPKVKVIR